MRLSVIGEEFVPQTALGEETQRRGAKKGNHFSEVGSASISLIFWAISRETGAALVDIPDLWPCFNDGRTMVSEC